MLCRASDNKVLRNYYATAGAQSTSVSVDGNSIIVAPGTEKGLIVLTVLLELPRSSMRTVVVHPVEPAAYGPVQFLDQPSVTSLKLAVTAPTGTK